MRPQHTNPGWLASLVLSYQLRVLRYPQRYAKTEALTVKTPIFQDVIKLRNVLDCQAKILEAVMV